MTADEDPARVLAALARLSLSRIDAPWTLRVAGYIQRKRRLLHFVNYHRDEAKGASIPGPAGECPLPATDVAVAVRLPRSARVRGVRLLSPDMDAPLDLASEFARGILRFRLPAFEVYAVAVVQLG